jgi:hypothetical protein
VNRAQSADRHAAHHHGDLTSGNEQTGGDESVIGTPALAAQQQSVYSRAAPPRDQTHLPSESQMPSFRVFRDRKSRYTHLAIIALLAIGIALTRRVFYPGVMTFDALYVHMYAVEGRYGDWQSPVMVAIWRLIDPLAPGPASMFCLIIALYWAAFAILAFRLVRARPWVAILTPLLALSPPAFVLAGVIWRDVLLATTWLLAAVLVLASLYARPRTRRSAQAVALALLAIGVLIRPNALVAAPILAVYIVWPEHLSVRRFALAFVPFAVLLFGLVQGVYYGVLDAKREHAVHSLFVFDLGGITHFAGRNVFPTQWTPDEERQLLTTCYDPRLWDVYWNREPCKFVMAHLEQQEHLFGTSALTRAWTNAILAEPRAYLVHRSTVMWTMLTGDHLVGWFVDLDDPSQTLRPNDKVFRRFEDLHERLRQTPIFRVGLWFGICIALVGLAWRRRHEACGAFAVATAGSAVVYVASYWPIAVAADYRYGYWATLAALAGIAAMLALPRATAKSRFGTPARS